MNITTLSNFKFLNKNNISYCYFQTAAGTLKILSTSDGVFEASFVDQEINDSNYTLNNNIDLTKIILICTDFQIKVWQSLLQIKKGKTCSYQDLAQIIGHKQSHRAVANAIAQNKIAYFIPCHRIIGKNGNPRGYKWGIDKKIALLNSELNKIII